MRKMVRSVKRHKGALLGVGVVAVGLVCAPAAHAQTSATAIVSSVSSVVTAVETLVGGAVAFFVAMKVVHWIRK